MDREVEEKPEYPQPSTSKAQIDFKIVFNKKSLT